jgi:K+-sensing histidine kinase KdpD
VNFPLAYAGPETGVLARYDDILLDQVLAALLDNAKRYALPGSVIELRLTLHDHHEVIFEVFNQGPHVADPEKIFLFGETSRDVASNQGIGLYAASQYVTSFGGSIHAENRPDGVAIVVDLVAG